jgi:FkbM family methyltransferase
MTEFCVSEIQVADVTLVLDSVLESWGEDDSALPSLLDGSYAEPATLAFWMACARRAGPEDILIDVGAFTGLFTLLGVKASTIGKVIAFEPSAVTYGRLVRNIHLNGAASRVIPCNLAAAEVEKTARFPHRWGIYAMCSGESFLTDQADHTQPAFCVPLDVLLDPLADAPYLSSQAQPVWPYRRVAAIKIDVERSEPQVLAGAQGLIAAYRPVIIAEVIDDAATRAMTAFAAGIGYQIAHIGHEANVAMFPPEDPHAAADLAAAIACPATVSGRRRLRFSP